MAAGDGYFDLEGIPIRWRAGETTPEIYHGLGSHGRERWPWYLDRYRFDTFAQKVTRAEFDELVADVDKSRVDVDPGPDVEVVGAVPTDPI